MLIRAVRSRRERIGCLRINKKAHCKGSANYLRLLPIVGIWTWQRARIAELRAEVANLADAIASGALKTSKALAERLSKAEAELDRLLIHKAAKKVNVVRLPMQLADRYRHMVSSLESELSRD